MKILALETSSIACSVALLCDEQITAEHQIAPMQHAQLLLPTIEKLLKSKNLTVKQLDAIAFGCGPGSFTGVRIATSVAQGLSFAAELPLIPISSLAALAQAAYESLGWPQLLVAIDARIQEIYWGAYQVNKTGVVERIGNEIVCPPTELVPDRSEHWHGVGNAWEIYQAQIPFKPVATDPSCLPTASAVLQLAKPLFLNKTWVRPEQGLPVYLRDKVVK